MKKIVLSLIAGWILFIATAYASPYDGYDITNKVEQYGDDVRTVAASPKPNNPPKQNYMYGDTNYPLVGLTTYGAIFLDKTSCKYEIADGVAIISCLVYYGGGGADGNGNAAKHSPTIIRFSTYKTDKRVIKFMSSVSPNTGKNDTESTYRSDNGFLNGLFWYCAGVLDLSQYLD